MKTILPLLLSFLLVLLLYDDAYSTSGSSGFGSSNSSSTGSGGSGGSTGSSSGFGSSNSSTGSSSGFGSSTGSGSSSGGGSGSSSGFGPWIPAPLYVSTGTLPCGPREFPLFLGISPLPPLKNEVIECPEVNCQQDDAFVQRATEYFEYEPSQTKGNREVLMDKSLHDYEINITGIKTRNSGYDMDYVDCNALTNNDPLSEPCQDNRWRDTCLIGNLNPDLDFAVYSRPLTSMESPWMGVAGSKPYFNEADTRNINCMPPKNTDRASALSDLNNGWLFRHMCPGSDPAISRVLSDAHTIKTDLFRGDAHCFAPKPKCTIGELQSDWKIKKGTPNEWRNKKYGKFLDILNEDVITNALGELLGGLGGALIPKHTLEQLRHELPPDKVQALKDLMSPEDSRAMECKPAFWARYAMSSCADQYIIQTSMDPNHVYEISGRLGLSPRFCQPLKMIPLQPDEKEYDVHDYLKRTANGLLHENYWPYIKFKRFPKIEARPIWTANMLLKVGELQIDGLGMNSGGALDDLFTPYNNPGMNEYAKQPVERVVDALHPFSPRYDVAESVKGIKLTDRLLFVGQTETPMFEGDTPYVGNLAAWVEAEEDTVEKAKKLAALPFIGLSGFWCMPEEEEGYFEYANEEEDCTTYCSAVDVDLLRFRYTDFRICMGCHIDANENAFWKEVHENEEHYQVKRCGKGRWIYQEGDYDDECDYQGDLCGSCERQNDHCALYATYQAICLLPYGIGAWACPLAQEQLEKCAKFIILCNACKYAAYAEAVERARLQINEKKEPTYGPSATNFLPPLGNMWPVCPTRFDEKQSQIRDGLCTMAKANVTACMGQVEEAIKLVIPEQVVPNELQGITGGDPNIGLDPESVAAATAAAGKCMNTNFVDLCHNAAKPVVPINILKTRIRKGDVRTAQPEEFETRKWEDETSTFRKTVDDDFHNTNVDAAPALDFRHYFDNHRPYMGGWDTGPTKESHQMGTRPDYWCDWASNDTIVGVGRDWNSIHGTEAQLCRYGGGDGIGGGTLLNTCFNVQKAQRYFPHLAGTEWAELKMYQARCARYNGLNCLCSQEQIFKDLGSEDQALSLLGGSFWTKEHDIKSTLADPQFRRIVEQFALSWRGYASTPIESERFPNLHRPPGVPSGIVVGGLDKAQPGDVAIWPAGIGTLPRVAIVVATRNLTDYYSSQDDIPGGENWVAVVDANNGKFPDICGNTEMLGYGPEQVIYADLDAFDQSTGKLDGGRKKRVDEQVVSTYYCEDSYLKACVERRWDKVIVWRPGEAEVRSPPIL